VYPSDVYASKSHSASVYSDHLLVSHTSLLPLLICAEAIKHKQTSPIMYFILGLEEDFSYKFKF